MIEVVIPGYGSLALEHLVLDFNGTLARDGVLIGGVADALKAIAGSMNIHVLTADTFDTASSALDGIPCRLTILPERTQAERKLDYVTHLGLVAVASVGNGRNDRLMLEASKLGIAVTEGEGASGDAMRTADIVCCGILDALELFLHPKRLVATLRS